MSKSVQAGLPLANGLARPSPAEELVELQRELERIRASSATRERIALVTGLVAERYGLRPEDAWELLVGVSQKGNIKLREVARLVLDGFCHRLAETDLELAGRLNRLGPSGRSPLIRLNPQERSD